MSLSLHRLAYPSGTVALGQLEAHGFPRVWSAQDLVEPAALSVMTHNMGLLVSPATYLGTNRSGAIAEIIAQIRLLKPDVVGLCEVFANGERAKIRNALKDEYAHWRDGPDEPDLESDGGLLVLSRRPFLAAADMIFRDSDGWDSLANKGVIYIRIRPHSWPVPLDVFYSHTQDISTTAGVTTLYAQLNAMNAFVMSHAAPTLPRLIMGDLNIPAEQPQHYAQLLSRLAGRATAGRWRAIPRRGLHVRDRQQFLTTTRMTGRRAISAWSYVLFKGGTRAVPILSNIQVLKIQRNGRYISDHFGLRATFDRMAVISP